MLSVSSLVLFLIELKIIYLFLRWVFFCQFNHYLLNLHFGYSDSEHIKIDANGVYLRVDQTGITDIQTNQKIELILPEDVEYHCKIGSGNGGIVKLAYHKKLGYPLAVKIINV